MIEKNIRVFVDSIVQYFGHTYDPSVLVGSPYLIDDIREASADYTGVISISGQYSGACYFSAPAVLLRHLILSVGESDTSETMMLDTVGEVANTLSGNARRELGRKFVISAPHIIKGTPNNSAMLSGTRIFAIPINWKSYKATLGICLNAQSSETTYIQ